MNRVGTWLLVLALLVTGGSMAWSQTKVAKTTVPTGGEIHGSVFAEVGDKTVRLSNIPVTLTEKGSTSTVDETWTDDLGRYYFERQKSGEYEVTPSQWGWEPSNPVIKFKLGPGTKHVKPIVVKPEDGVAIVGEITQEGEGTSFGQVPSAGFRQTVEVGLRTGPGEHNRYVANVNAFGEFVAAGLTSGPLTVEARLVQTRDTGQKQTKEVSEWIYLKSVDTKRLSRGGVVSLETLSLPSGVAVKATSSK